MIVRGDSLGGRLELSASDFDESCGPKQQAAKATSDKESADEYPEHLNLSCSVNGTV